MSYFEVLKEEVLKELSYRGLEGWTVKPRTSKRTSLGQCFASGKEIRLNMNLLDRAEWEVAYEVIAHEVCHARLAGRGVQAHGREWREMMKTDYGIEKPRATLEVKLSEEEQFPVYLVCQQGHYLGQYRVPQRLRACGKCEALAPQNIMYPQRDGKLVPYSKLSKSLKEEYKLFKIFTKTDELWFERLVYVNHLF